MILRERIKERAMKDDICRACSSHERCEKNRIVVRKLEGKMPLQRARCGCDDNINMYFKYVRTV